MPSEELQEFYSHICQLPSSVHMGQVFMDSLCDSQYFKSYWHFIFNSDICDGMKSLRTHLCTFSTSTISLPDNALQNAFWYSSIHHDIATLLPFAPFRIFDVYNEISLRY